MNEVPKPEAVGLNENAAISRDVNDSEKLLAGVRLTQPMAGTNAIHLYWYISEHFNGVVYCIQTLSLAFVSGVMR